MEDLVPMSLPEEDKESGMISSRLVDWKETGLSGSLEPFQVPGTI